ncbi:MAG: LemA family protein [Bacilli bacterium]|nr:LemA family protein [Bacilli bacterium]
MSLLGGTIATILIVGGIALVAIIVLLIIFVIGIYNNIVKAKMKVDNQFAQIDVQLKKRFDLIPNIVETVKGYAKHESETLENVIKARNTYLTATSPEEKLEANNQVTQAMNKLFALAESYPDLKANTNYLELQDTLKETEDKIAYARQFYNDAVMKYNRLVMTIPSNIVAMIFGFKAINYLEATSEERQNVKVQF